MKSVLWRVAKRLSYIEDAQCLKVKTYYLLSTTWFLKQWYTSTTGNSTIVYWYAVSIKIEI